MALIALLGGSTIGAIAGLVSWLFLGVGLAGAFGLYLACGLCLPAAVIAVLALRGTSASQTDTAYAEDGEAMVA
ncbi:MAG: hypothetical protein EP318_11055 [Rhodobacteraceae bacterium]|nr:MAG: hypothetical protein EP318_11055 [Paracoccaceae bacterium]